MAGSPESPLSELGAELIIDLKELAIFSKIWHGMVPFKMRVVFEQCEYEN